MSYASRLDKLEESTDDSRRAGFALVDSTGVTMNGQRFDRREDETIEETMARARHANRCVKVFAIYGH